MIFHKTTLGEICTQISGGFSKAPVFDDTGEYFFINGSDIVDGHLSINKNTRKVNKTEYNKYRKDLTSATILLSVVGTIGNLARFNGEKCVLGRGVAYLNITPDVNPDYVYYQLKSRDFQEYIKNSASGSVIKDVSLEILRNYVFNIPNRRVQDVYVRILKTLDSEIKVNSEINDNF